MWLPKDERRLLAGYYTQIGEINTEKVYRLRHLARLLSFRGYRLHVPEYGDSESSSENVDDLGSNRAVKKYIDDCNRINKANSLLAGRRLAMVTPHQEDGIVIIALTVEGYDLGRRFSNIFDSSGLCFQEYRNHWIWLIVSFFGGAICVKLLDVLVSLFADC